MLTLNIIHLVSIPVRGFMVVVVVETKFLLKAKGWRKRVVSYLAFVLLLHIKKRKVAFPIQNALILHLAYFGALVEMPCPFSSFKFAFSAQAWRCRSVLGSNFALVECSDVVSYISCAGTMYSILFGVVPFMFWWILIVFCRACAVHRECLQNVAWLRQIQHLTV